MNYNRLFQTKYRTKIKQTSMKSEPLVSVIVPNYNHQKYLKERIDSILNQDYSNYEIIILDDHSSDCSIDVINQYRNHPKVTHICINEKNSGSTFVQWQKGISMSSGDYIWLAESDDKADSRFISTLIGALHSHSSASIAFCNSYLINSEGDIISKDIDKDDYCKSLYTFHSGQNFVEDMMVYGNRVHNASAAIFKKQACEQTDTFYASLKFCGDWIFWMELMRVGDVIWVHRKYNQFRQHLQKVSPKAISTGLDFQETHQVVKYLKKTFDLSYVKTVSFLGHIFLRLVASRTISFSAKKHEFIQWLKEYPFIPFYGLFRASQIITRRFLSIFHIVAKYKFPRIAN